MTGTALVLAAHGAGDGSPANGFVHRCAAELAGSSRFDEVVPAFRRGTPRYAEILDRITSTDVTVVPLMTSCGYLYETVLPRDLAGNQRFASIAVRITPPVGTHPAVVDLVVALAAKTIQRHALDPAATAIMIVGHGTKRHRRSRAATFSLCDELRRRSICARIEPAFLDVSPQIEETCGAVDQCCLVVVPFLLGGGQHATWDLPRRLGMTVPPEAVPPVSGRVGHRLIVCAEALGTDPGIVEIVRQLAAESGARLTGQLFGTDAGNPATVSGNIDRVSEEPPGRTSVAEGTTDPSPSGRATR